MRQIGTCTWLKPPTLIKQHVAKDRTSNWDVLLSWPEAGVSPHAHTSCFMYTNSTSGSWRQIQPVKAAQVKDSSPEWFLRVLKEFQLAWIPGYIYLHQVCVGRTESEKDWCIFLFIYPHSLSGSCWAQRWFGPYFFYFFICWGVNITAGQ